ncbi:hypothetical protein [Pollutibacter soli]|uniref:hypothetical protein n=1 Tax=Pollutibacter soli TaxID=3034157 RepID=UPI003013FC7E
MQKEHEIPVLRKAVGVSCNTLKPSLQMAGYYKEKVKSDIFSLGIYQIAGGLIGIVKILFAFFVNFSFNGLEIIFYVIMLSFFIFSVFAGFACINGRSDALKFSSLNQYFQILSFSILSLSFSYIAGVYLSINFDITNSTELDLGFGYSKFSLRIDDKNEKTYVHINLIAIGLVYWIDKLKSRNQNDIEFAENNSVKGS